MISAAYSLNADNLDGEDSAFYLNTSSTAQTKLAGLTILDGLSDNKLTLAGGNWNADVTDGDFKIGNDTYKFKIGIATSGAGAGATGCRCCNTRARRPRCRCRPRGR